MKHKHKIVGSVAAMAVAVSLIGDFEGKRNQAYRDVVGVWTLCYGETRGVKRGDTATDAQCDAMLAKAIAEFEAGLDKCMIVDVPIKVKIAFVSWAYNVGIGAACKSTLVRLANAGELKAACNQLPRWSRAGGRVIDGLTTRRIKERDVCLSALGDAEIAAPPPAPPLMCLRWWQKLSRKCR